ncbi:MAG: DUF3137 domain-containing protein [Lentisphaeria bacterium]|nr:DUF3137 domain-containing protein [Lentisphaeria bacterium]
MYAHEPDRSSGEPTSSFSPELMEALAELRLRRDRTRKTALIVTAVCLVLFLLLGLGFMASEAGSGAEAGGMLIGFLITAVFLAAIPYTLMMRGVKLQYKKLVVPALLRDIDPGLTYDPAGYIPKADFKRAKIFSYRADSYHGEDLVRGTYKGVPIRFSELKVQEVHNNGKNTNRHTFFDGVFLIADFHKDFKYRHWVLPDTAEAAFGQVFGNFLQKLNLPGRGHMTRMEDPAFEKKFVVYTEDDVEARYILTPKLMQTMMSLYDRYRTGASRLAFAFLESNVFIAIPMPSGRNLFEMPSHGDLGEEAVRRTQAELKEILSVFDAMDLDLRLWSKH